MDVGLLLHFVVALGDEALAEVDGASAGQVQVRVQPRGGDDVQGGRPPEIMIVMITVKIVMMIVMMIVIIVMMTVKIVMMIVMMIVITRLGVDRVKPWN